MDQLNYLSSSSVLYFYSVSCTLDSTEWDGSDWTGRSWFPGRWVLERGFGAAVADIGRCINCCPCFDRLDD